MESVALLFTGGALLAAAFYWFVCIMGPAEQKGKRGVDLSGGSISADQVQDNYKRYWSFFRRPKEIEAADKVPDFVDTFYNLVTDIYEWGWGQSFHFAPSVPGKSHAHATRLYEIAAVDLIKVRPGDRILDVGCGIGGPMRAIADHSRANVVGITINNYQVNRARLHNKKAGLETLCEVVQGNFLQMPFQDSTFDGAYSIEATCHAPQLEDVYAEIFRVLKPDSMYMSYEWVTTEEFRSDDSEHVDIIQDVAAPPAGEWWTRLKMGRIAYWRNHVLVTVLAALRIAPKGTVDVHEMLCETAVYLTKGGEMRIFSPMYMVLCRKPVQETAPLN
ncbi:24-methylenesterol C-methyltransferase 2 [Linum perenne]